MCPSVACASSVDVISFGRARRRLERRCDVQIYIKLAIGSVHSKTGASEGEEVAKRAAAEGLSATKASHARAIR